MSGNRILIVSSSPLCKNPRALKEADTLGRAGYQVTVLTISGRESYEAFDREILKGAPFQKIALPYFGFRGLLGLGAHSSRVFTFFARRLIPFRIERRSALGAFHRLFRVARRTPADLTIVHTELGLAVGYELLRHGRKVAVDIEDWHSRDLLPSARSRRPLRMLENYERGLLQRAAYTSTTSQAMADALHAAYGGQKPSVITNSFPLQTELASDHANSMPAIFWLSQTVGPGRGLEPFLQAWNRTTTPSRLCLLGEISPPYKNQLPERVTGHKKTLIEFLPLTSPSRLPQLIARHDIGLALEETIPANKDLTISNKILHYLNAGLAVVASSTAGHREVIAENPAAGILVDAYETTAFARSLDNLLSDSAALTRRQQAARLLAEKKYCWEREAPRLLALVEEALSQHGSPIRP